MRFGRGNLRGGNLIVKTLIFPYFLRLPRQAEVVTYEVTELSHSLNFCRSDLYTILLYLDVVRFISQDF